MAATLFGESLARQRRRIASLKPNLALGPAGHTAVAAKAVRWRCIGTEGHRRLEPPPRSRRRPQRTRQNPALDAAAASRSLTIRFNLCMTLAYVGRRLSEALALNAERVYLAAGVLVCVPSRGKNDPTGAIFALSLRIEPPVPSPSWQVAIARPHRDLGASPRRQRHALSQ